MAKTDFPKEQTSATAVPEKKKYYAYTCHSAKLTIYEAGQKTGNDGKPFTWAAGIKLKSAAMKAPELFSARELIAIYHTIHDNEELRGILRERQAAERAEDKDL